MARTSFAYPPRIPCALLPTRIERLARYGERVGGVEVWIKRDDLTGFLLSGNKVRKLEFSFARALSDGATGVVTTGGVNSNHCRATVALAARLGLETHLFLRTPDGKRPAMATGNTLFDLILGARVTWITPEEYRQRDALMARYAAEHRARGARLAVFPEGASDAVGALGYVHAVEELAGQLRAKNLSLDVLVHAMGSGGTTAGLAAGRAQFGLGFRLVGVPVCDDEAYFRARVTAIREGLTALGLPTEEGESELEVLDGYQGRGYGLTTPEELGWIRDFARLEGILLDPCYTGKAFLALHREILARRFPAGSRILFWHTGGGFANFAYQEEWGAVL